MLMDHQTADLMPPTAHQLRLGRVQGKAFFGHDAAHPGPHAGHVRTPTLRAGQDQVVGVAAVAAAHGIRQAVHAQVQAKGTQVGQRR